MDEPSSLHVASDDPGRFYASLAAPPGLSAEDYEALRQYAAKSLFRGREGAIFVYDDPKAEALEKSRLLGNDLTEDELRYSKAHVCGLVFSRTGGPVGCQFNLPGGQVYRK